MKVGDLVCWKSELMYGLLDGKPMVIVELASLNYDVRVINPSTGWSVWASEEELYLISSRDH